MKRFFRFAALLLPVALLVASCAKEFGSEEGGPRRTYDFVGYLDSSTKTDLDDNDHTIWKAGDPVAFYTAGTADAQIKTVEIDGPIAEFYVDAAEYVNAVYGANVVQSGKRGMVLKDVVKANQDGSFGDAHVSVAHTLNLENPELHFRNITSMLRFKVKSQDVAFVRVYSRTKAQLGGDVQVMFDTNTGEPSASFTGENPVYSIRVSTQDKDGYFYVSLLPGTYKGGIEVRCFNRNGSRIASAASKNDFTLAKNRILDMGILDIHFAPDPVDLSTILGESITANCYIAPEYGEYKFPVVTRGNSTTPVSLDEPFSVEVLWETFGTTDEFEPGSVVSDVSYGDGYVYLTTLHDGSAIIAVRDAIGNILWSWHIWVWKGYDIIAAAQMYYNEAGSMMDRNLGAASAIVGDPGARGSLYQWGRKDPFPGASTKVITSPYGSTIPSPVPMSSNTTVAYSVANPMTFIYSTDSNGDWLPYTDDSLWSSSKTMYDPCPPGWKVPDADFWYKAMKNSVGGTKTFDRTLYGIDFAGDNNGYSMGQGPSIWYPATGYRDAKSTASAVSFIQWYGFWWSSGASGYLANYFAMNGSQNTVQTMAKNMRASGLSVRCQLDFTPPEVEVQSITLDKQSLSLKRYGFEQLTAAVFPSYATHPEVKWETSNAAVATVDNTGLVRGVGEGMCTITAVAVSNPNTSASCSVTVERYDGDGGTETGLYLGIIGFNQELYKTRITRLDDNSRGEFDYFIDGLFTKNGTLLYYSVDEAISTLQNALYPDDLFSVSLITFTDGLDQGSSMMINNYPGDSEYLDILHNRLSNSTVSGVPLTAYSVGLRGSDVSDVNMFRNNLKKLAYPEDNAYEVSDMYSVNARFQEMADQVNKTMKTSKYDLRLSIPGQANGTRMRFTLDGAVSATSSAMYIEGTFNLSSKSLTNVTYHGFTCSSGSTVPGEVNGIIVSYSFSDVVPSDNRTISQYDIRHWIYVSSTGSWQKNSEFDTGNDVNMTITRTKKTAVVLLNLDCSRSLDNQFYTLQSHAKSFVSTLYNAAYDPYEVTGVTLDQSTMTLYEGSSATLTATVSPYTATVTSVQWTSSNISVATVDSNGEVTGVRAGTAVITATTNDGGYTAKCSVTVRAR